MRAFRLLLAAGLGVGLALLAMQLAGPALTLRAAPPSQVRYVATSGRDELAGGVPSACVDSSDPCRTVQHAVDVAGAGDEVRVATGVYTDVSARQGEEQVLFISRTVAVRGGYAVGFGEWDPKLFSATLDAGEQGRVVWIKGTAEGLVVVLEALRLANGSTGHGAGVYAMGAQVTISGCDVINGTADESGGGIYLSESDGSAVINTVVADTSGIINGCGGICVEMSDDVELDRVHVSGSQGTGVYVVGGARVTASHSVIHDNTALQLGGIGFTRTRGASVMYSSIYSNTALDAASGVSIIESDGAVVIGNQVSRNQSDMASGIYVGDSKDARLVNNIVWGNTILDLGLFREPYAPGILIRSADGAPEGTEFNATLLHNTVIGNVGAGGEGVYVEVGDQSVVTMVNTLVVSQSVGVYVTEGNTVTLEATLWGTGTWANGQDWAGKGTVLTGTINVWGLPDFVDAARGDYHIGLRSAAIDSGIDAGVADDIDRDPRPLGTGPDIGADEYVWLVHLPIVLQGWS